MKNQVLDDTYFTGWGRYALNEKDIKWVGKPHIEYTIRFLGADSHHDVMTGLSSIFMIYLFFLITVAYLLSELGYEMAAILIGIIGIIFPFAYELIRSAILRKTQYAITEKYVLFKFFNGFKYYIKAIPMEQIIRPHLMEMNNGKGTVFVITNRKEDFTTYNGQTSEKQNHPTLELLEDYEKAFALINKYKTTQKLEVPRYQEPLISESVLKYSKYIYIFLLSIMSIYSIDYYVIPNNIQVDQIVEVKQGAHTRSSKNGNYLTEKGYRFSMPNYLPKMEGMQVSLKTTFLYGTVKEVIELENNHQKLLTSGLNRITFKFSFFLLLLILLISTALIYNKKVITKEFYFKILLSIIVFSGMLYLFWHLNN